MTDFPISGGCQCGAVRYTVQAPPTDVAHCHCAMCCKTNGSLFWTGATIAAEHLTIEGKESLTSYQSSPGLVRQFCRTCGCTLFGRPLDAPETIYFTPATLDGGVHPGHPPGSEAHYYVGSKVAWKEITDDLPQFETE